MANGPRPARLRRAAGAAAWRTRSGRDQAPALSRIALIMAAKGGTVRDITVGDCLELLGRRAGSIGGRPAVQPVLLPAAARAGVFPADAAAHGADVQQPPASSASSNSSTATDLTCRPVRDLLVDYLRERQAARRLHHACSALADTPGPLFWKDLERHHPGIDSLRLRARRSPPAWKQRDPHQDVRHGRPTARPSRPPCRSATRRRHPDHGARFYLDLAQWALDDPARWGPWAVPCPIRADDIQHKKEHRRRKSRMDQRTRDRLPVLPALIAAVDRQRTAAAARSGAAARGPPGRDVHRRRPYAAPRRVHRPPSGQRLGRGPGHRRAPRPDPRGRPRVLGLGRGRGPAPHRHPDRGTDRTDPSQPGPVPAARPPAS